MGAKLGVKGVKEKYQLVVIKEPFLRVVVEAEVYKAIIAKIEAYEESDRRFERLNNRVGVDHAWWNGPSLVHTTADGVAHF